MIHSGRTRLEVSRNERRPERRGRDKRGRGKRASKCHTSGGVVRVQCCHCRGEQLIRSPGLREARRPPWASSSPLSHDSGSRSRHPRRRRRWQQRRRWRRWRPTARTTVVKASCARAFSRYRGWQAGWQHAVIRESPSRACYVYILIDQPSNRACLASRPAPSFVLSFLLPPVLPPHLSLFLSFSRSTSLSLSLSPSLSRIASGGYVASDAFSLLNARLSLPRARLLLFSLFFVSGGVRASTTTTTTTTRRDDDDARSECQWASLFAERPRWRSRHCQSDRTNHVRRQSSRHRSRAHRTSLSRTRRRRGEVRRGGTRWHDATRRDARRRDDIAPKIARASRRNERKHERAWPCSR